MKRQARRSEAALAEHISSFMVRTQCSAGAGVIRGCFAWQWLRISALAYGWMSHDTTRGGGRDETAVRNSASNQLSVSDMHISTHLSYFGCMLSKGGPAQDLIKRPPPRRLPPKAYEPQDVDSSA